MLIFALLLLRRLCVLSHEKIALSHNTSARDPRGERHIHAHVTFILAGEDRPRAATPTADSQVVVANVAVALQRPSSVPLPRALVSC